MKWFTLVFLFATLPLPAANVILEPRLGPLTPKEKRLEHPCYIVAWRANDIEPILKALAQTTYAPPAK